MCSSSSHHVFGHVPTVFQRVPYTSVGTWNTPWNTPDNAVTSRNPWNTFQTNSHHGTQPPPGAPWYSCP